MEKLSHSVASMEGSAEPMGWPCRVVPTWAVGLALYRSLDTDLPGKRAAVERWLPAAEEIPQED